MALYRADGGMALAHAILTALSHDPLSGYDLAKVFRTSTGFFWRASSQQIYAELRRLHDKGMLTGNRQAQERYPDKIIYSITAAGQAMLKAWLDTPSGPASIKEELVVKFYAMDLADLPCLIEQVIARQHHHAERLSLYRMIEQRITNGDDASSVGGMGRLIGVRAGIRFEQAMHDWCDDAVDSMRLIQSAATEAAS